MEILSASPIAGRTPPSAVVFGPHVTNLGAGRSISTAHADYYGERAAGGTGIIVTETASVHSSDWPYERAPLAAECADGWRRVVDACRPYGTIVLAGLGHRGLQGTSAHTRSALWGPSAVADPAARELPMVMGRGEVDGLVAGFADGARRAVDAGMDGVEIDAGPQSLLRQFLSDLTNHRDDDYGRERSALLLGVLDAVRSAMGGTAVLGLRLTCDEAVPWGGITPASAEDLLPVLAPSVDLLTVVRGGLYTVDAYRPGMTGPPGLDVAPGFNAALCRRMRAAAGETAVVLQGSVVDVADADRAVADGTANLVEMTRAQIADPRLVVHARSGTAPRPCVLCNQACMVDDVRNPLVDCIVQPRPASTGSAASPVFPPAPVSSSERDDPQVQDALIIGAGAAGLSAALDLAAAGIQVTVLERASGPGGLLRTAVSVRPRLGVFMDWLESECSRLGVHIECDTADGAERGAAALARGIPVVAATGGLPRASAFPCHSTVDAAALLGDGGAAADDLPPGRLLVWDPIGGPIGVAVAMWLTEQGREVAVATPDPVVGSELARGGDLVGANVRLQRAGVVRHLFSVVREQRDGTAVLENRHTGERTTVECAAVVDCSPRRPGQWPAGSAAFGDIGAATMISAGDCVAPRTVLEAVREGRHAARRILNR